MAEELIAGVCNGVGGWWCNPVSGSGFEGGGSMVPAVPASCSAHSSMNGAAVNWASALDIFDFIEPRPYYDSSSSPVSISEGPLAFPDIYGFSQVPAPLTETWSHALLTPALIQAQQDSSIRSNHQPDGGLMDNSSLIDPMKGENQIFSVENNSFKRKLTGTQLCQESLPELNNCSTESSKSSANLTKEAPWSFNPPVPADSLHQTNFDESFRCSNQAVKKANKGAEKRSESEPPLKKPRIETPSQLPTFKVRKEKLGDRITALQQLVSPFGKTDTASVLHEAIDYIRFLHDQLRVLSAPYLKKDHRHITEQEEEDLSSRGLCLVPVSATFAVARDNPMDFWAAFLGGTFRNINSSSAKVQFGELMLWDNSERTERRHAETSLIREGAVISSIGKVDKEKGTVGAFM